MSELPAHVDKTALSLLGILSARVLGLLIQLRRGGYIEEVPFDPRPTHPAEIENDGDEDELSDSEVAAQVALTFSKFDPVGGKAKTRPKGPEPVRPTQDQAEDFRATITSRLQEAATGSQGEPHQGKRVSFALQPQHHPKGPLVPPPAGLQDFSRFNFLRMPHVEGRVLKKGKHGSSPDAVEPADDPLAQHLASIVADFDPKGGPTETHAIFRMVGKWGTRIFQPLPHDLNSPAEWHKLVVRLMTWVASYPNYTEPQREAQYSKNYCEVISRFSNIVAAREEGAAGSAVQSCSAEWKRTATYITLCLYYFSISANLAYLSEKMEDLWSEAERMINRRPICLTCGDEHTKSECEKTQQNKRPREQQQNDNGHQRRGNNWRGHRGGGKGRGRSNSGGRGGYQNYNQSQYFQQQYQQPFSQQGQPFYPPPPSGPPPHQGQNQWSNPQFPQGESFNPGRGGFQQRGRGGHH